MIPINRLHEMMLDIKADVNLQLDTSTVGRRIAHVVASATETHFINKLKDNHGVVLGFKMPDADTNMQSIDNYSENNKMLVYVLEKADPGKINDKNEREMYAELQEIMRLVKQWIAQRGLNGNMCGGDETLSLQKPYHTEWEYNTFGGFYGLSISFELIDYQL